MGAGSTHAEYDNIDRVPSPGVQVKDCLGKDERRPAMFDGIMEAHPEGGGQVAADQELPAQMVPFMRVGYCLAGAGRASTEVDWGVVSVAPLNGPPTVWEGPVWKQKLRSHTNPLRFSSWGRFVDRRLTSA